MTSFEQRQRLARGVLVTALVLLALWTVADFVPALLWAAVIAIAIDPLYRRAELRWGPRAGTLLAALFTLAVAVLVLVPITLVLIQAAKEARDLAHWLAGARAHGVPVPDWVGHLPVGREAMTRWWRDNLATPEGTVQQLRRLDSAALIAHSRLLGRGLLHRLVIFGFTLITLFFLLKDRDVIVVQLMRAARHQFGAQGERLGRQVVRSVRGTIDGLVLVGIGEGAAMLPVYLLTGTPHPILMAAVTGIAAMIPFGAAAVFAIAALMLVAKGAIVAAVLVIAIGLAIVGIADHFVRPALIGGATRLPFLWVLVGIFGGVESYGLLGLFVGPAVMAALIMIWREWLGETAPGDETVSA